MKSDRVFLIYQRVLITFIAFCVGCILTFLLRMFVLDADIFPKSEDESSVLTVLIKLGVDFGLVGLGGLIVAGLSFLVHPTVTLRIYHLIAGMFVLLLGAIWMIAATSFFPKYVLGPVAVISALYVIWKAVAGSRADVEDL